MLRTRNVAAEDNRWPDQRGFHPPPPKHPSAYGSRSMGTGGDDPVSKSEPAQGTLNTDIARRSACVPRTTHLSLLSGFASSQEGVCMHATWRCCSHQWSSTFMAW